MLHSPDSLSHEWTLAVFMPYVLDWSTYLHLADAMLGQTGWFFAVLGFKGYPLGLFMTAGKGYSMLALQLTRRASGS